MRKSHKQSLGLLLKLFEGAGELTRIQHFSLNLQSLSWDSAVARPDTFRCLLSIFGLYIRCEIDQTSARIHDEAKRGLNQTIQGENHGAVYRLLDINGAACVEFHVGLAQFS